MFSTLLGGTVSRVPGAIAAIFLDHEGETIDYAANGVTRHDARIFGAYLGIFLARAARAVDSSPARMKIAWKHLTAIAIPLSDGYYLVLLLRKPYVEALALRELEKASHELAKEL
jgi:hypothetical protein